jgi:hypothetical protein
MGFTAPIVTKLITGELQSMESYTEFHINRTRNMEIIWGNSFTSLTEVHITAMIFIKLMFPQSFMSATSIPDFMTIQQTV